MWCIHNKKPIFWAYWIFNQLLSCAPHKDSPLTHGHEIIIVAKALNVDLPVILVRLNALILLTMPL